VGNSSVQNTRTAWINQGAAVPDSTYQEAGYLAVPESGSTASNSALRPATHALIDDAVREAPTSLSLPGERVGAPTTKRCIPLFASVVHCPGRKPGHVCVSVPVAGFFRVCAVGHTQLPTSSTIFRHFVKGRLHD
jgi:hypothetical protein